MDVSVTGFQHLKPMEYNESSWYAFNSTSITDVMPIETGSTAPKPFSIRSGLMLSFVEQFWVIEPDQIGDFSSNDELGFSAF